MTASFYILFHMPEKKGRKCSQAFINSSNSLSILETDNTTIETYKIKPYSVTKTVFPQIKKLLGEKMNKVDNN